MGTATGALTRSLVVVYAARFLAGAGAAAIVPGAQAYVVDISNALDRSRRFVLLGSAAFVGFLAGPAFGSWLAGPVMGVRAGQMPDMVNGPALLVATLGVPLLVAAPIWLGARRERAPARAHEFPMQRRRFVGASMLLALLASFAAGTFEVGGQTLGLPSATLAAMFVTCSAAMLAAQSLLLLPAVRKRIDGRWVAATFVASALALGFVAVKVQPASKQPSQEEH